MRMTWQLIAYFVSASTPDLAQALGTTCPDPLSVYVVDILRNAAPKWKNTKNTAKGQVHHSL